MKIRFNLLGAAVLMALALGAVSASGASASVLELKQEGTPVPKGAPTFAGLRVEECIEFSQGTLGTNGKSTDKAAFTSAASTECEGSTTLSGFVTSAQVTTTGKASFKSTISLTGPGPCVYVFKKFSALFELTGGITFGSGEMTGKLNKGASSKTCAKTHTAEFSADLSPAVGGSPFEMEVH